MAVAGLVLGIVSLVLCWFGWLSVISLPVAIVALILSVVGGKKKKSGVATAGLVIGIIAVVLNAILFFTCGLCSLCVMCEAKAAGDALNALA